MEPENEGLGQMMFPCFRLGDFWLIKGCTIVSDGLCKNWMMRDDNDVDVDVDVDVDDDDDDDDDDDVDDVDDDDDDHDDDGSLSSSIHDDEHDDMYIIYNCITVYILYMINGYTL